VTARKTRREKTKREEKRQEEARRDEKRRKKTRKDGEKTRKKTRKDENMKATRSGINSAHQPLAARTCLLSGETAQEEHRQQGAVSMWTKEEVEREHQ
jgi:hypothetical protein